jgi:HSP20 family protein
MDMALLTNLPTPWRRRNAVAESQRDPFLALHREMNRLFDEAFRGFGLGTLPTTFGGEAAPALDVRETDNAIEVVAELPGVEEKDVDVSVRDGVLTVRGEKRISREDKDGDWHLTERSHGSFARSITLPVGVDDSKATAEFRNGVLTVTLPKTAEAESKLRRIPIKGA